MIQLTGKVFVQNPVLKQDKETFQLEANIDGVVTRLVGEGSVPEACLFDRRHSGLRIKNVLESFPPQYEIECGCGYNVVMRDVNSGYQPLEGQHRRTR